MASEFLLIDLSSSAGTDLAGIVDSSIAWVDKTYNEIQLSDDILEPEAFVFRLDTNWSWHISASGENHLIAAFRTCLNERFDVTDAAIYLLYSDNYQIRLVGEDRQRPAEYLAKLKSRLRESELKEMAFSSGALYHNSGTYLFEHPSGEVSDFFFRAGNIQSNYEELEKLWFWATPHLKGVTSIVCDTWSISTLGAYIALKLPSYDNTTSGIGWSYLRGYIGDDAGLGQDLSLAFKNAANSASKILFLLSASASGRSHNSICKIGADENFPTDRYSILTLFALSNKVQEEEHLCNLSNHISDIGLEGFGIQETVTESSIKYTIDKQTYFPSYYVDAVHPFHAGITHEHSHTKDSKRFFEEYSGHGLFSVCRDGDSNSSLNKSRHHAFHVDVKQLFQLKQFQAKLDLTLVDIPKITHLVHNSKEADRQLAELVKDRLGYNFDVIEVNSFRELSRTESFYEAFTLSDASFLVLDAQAISGGSRLSRFQITLRELFNDHEIDGPSVQCQINYLVGLARFDANDDLQKTRRFFPQSAPGSKEYLKFLTVEQIVLPDWHADQCPWCREREILLNVMKVHDKDMKGRERSHVDRRLRELSSTNGLKNGVFSRRYNSDNFDFNPGSFFLDKLALPDGVEMSEADLVCAVSSALQSWRASTFQEAPANYVIDCDVVFSPNMFNETLLRAAIWRSLRPREFAILNSDNQAMARNLLESVFNSSELDKADNREGEFVLGLEAALSLGNKIQKLLGEESFSNIDWEFLQHVANRDRPSTL